MSLSDSSRTSAERRVVLRGAAKIMWEEYASERNAPRFIEWRDAIVDLMSILQRRDYIPRVSMHLTDAATKRYFGVSVVYIIREGEDYMFFYYEKEIVVVFFISTPVEEMLDAAFNAQRKL